MQKTARLGLVLTIQEKSWVKRLSEIEGGLSQAALIRRLIWEAALKHSLVISTSHDNMECKEEGSDG